MNLKRKTRYGFIKHFLLMLFGWFAFYHTVNGATAYCPFISDDWVSFEIQMPFVENEPVTKIDSQKTRKKGSVGTTKSEKTINNLKRYDRLSDSEKKMLYKIVSMECDTGYEGSLAVISCMMNRLESDRYPDDLMEVVTEDSQFTAYYDKETDTYPYITRQPSKECIAAVDDALNKGKRNLPSYILYFRSSKYNYLEGYERYGQIGDNIYFYKSEDK